MQNVYVVDAVRTPIGKYGGVLSSVRPDDLLALVIKKLVERNPNVDVNQIEDVIAGAANQSGEDNRNVARMGLLLAGLPETIGGVTVNRLCASGLEAIMDAYRTIACGHGEIVIAGGVESMSRAPYVVSKAQNGFDRKQEMFDTTMGWRFINDALAQKYYPYTMGETAENVAKKYNISRVQQDEFALSSQQKYADAAAENKFADEVVTVSVKQNKETVEVAIDEHPRPTTIDALANLKPAFIENGTVTAGNSSGINDGAAALLLASEAVVLQNRLPVLGKVKTMSVAGVDPAIMGMGPVPAVQKVLERANLTIDDIDLFELNEAFASQAVACMQALQIPVEKVNVNGGAIALGHPLGGSGARISTTLLHEMKKRKVRYGIATMCVGVGQGAAILFENTNT